jgi:hypothetical protein
MSKVDVGRSQNLFDCTVQWPTPREKSPSLSIRTTVSSSTSILSTQHFKPSYSCLADAALCKLSSSMIHSFIYSHDIVSRLSLGSARDMTLAATWLCAADEKGNGEGYAGIARRALMTKAGYGDTGNADWVCFLAVSESITDFQSSFCRLGRRWRRICRWRICILLVESGGHGEREI